MTLRRTNYHTFTQEELHELGPDDRWDDQDWCPECDGSGLERYTTRAAERAAPDQPTTNDRTPCATCLGDGRIPPTA